MDPILLELNRINAAVVRPKQEAMLSKQNQTAKENAVASSQAVPRDGKPALRDVDSVDVPVCELSGVSQDPVSARYRCPHSPRRVR